NCARCYLYVTKLSPAIRVPEDRDTRQDWHSLLGQFKALRHQLGRSGEDACDVSAWMGQTVNHSRCHRVVVEDRCDDGDFAGGLLCGEKCWLRSDNNHVDIE